MLPVVLLALVSLALLSALVLFDAVQEWRVAGLADDRVLALAALQEGVDASQAPSDLPALCVSPPLAWHRASAAGAGGGRYEVTWSHLGDGIVRGVVEGTGRLGARAQAIVLLLPDSSVRDSGLFRCPTATRLVPLGPGWLVAGPLD